MTFSTFRTLANLFTCLISFSTSPSLQITEIVKIALSMFSPTASDSMLYPRRANTPATRLIIPVSSATYTSTVCLRNPSASRAGPWYTSPVLPRPSYDVGVHPSPGVAPAMPASRS